MTPLFKTIVEKVSPPPVDMDGPFQMQVSSLDYNTYVGVIGIGRIQRGMHRLHIVDQHGTLERDAFQQAAALNINVSERFHLDPRLLLAGAGLPAIRQCWRQTFFPAAAWRA